MKENEDDDAQGKLHHYYIARPSVIAQMVSLIRKLHEQVNSQPNQNREPRDNRGKWWHLAAGYIIVCIGMKQNHNFPTGLLVK